MADLGKIEKKDSISKYKQPKPLKDDASDMSTLSETPTTCNPPHLFPQSYKFMWQKKT